MCSESLGFAEVRVRVRVRVRMRVRVRVRVSVRLRVRLRVRVTALGLYSESLAGLHRGGGRALLPRESHLTLRLL